MRTLRAGQVLPSSWISVSHAARPAGFTPGELDWPGTWTDRAGRDRTLSVPGHELSGVVVELGYGTTGLTVGQRVFGLTDWTRDGSLAEYTAVEARNLAPSPPTSTTPWRQRYRSPGSPRRPPRSPATGAVPARRSSRSRMIWREMSVRDRRAVLAGGCFWRCRISSALALVFCSRVWATPGVTRPTPPTAATTHTPRPSRSPTTHPPPPTASCWSSSSRSTTQHLEPAGQ